MATRHERVVLDLEDRFTAPMARAAAATAALDKSLRGLDGSTVRTNRSTSQMGPNFDRTGRSAASASRDIDRFSGRLGLLRDAAITLGPALVPIGAIAVPAVAGLAAQFGAAAIAGGTALAAFQGVGTALEAVNKAALEPTTENLEAAQIAMESLAPAAQSAVRQLQSMRPALAGMRDAAAAGFFPGMVEGLRDLETVFPKVEDILFSVGTALGDLAAEAGESLAGPRWAAFLSFVETEVPSALTELGRTMGNLTHGLAEMWMAFTPLNRDFSSWMLEASRSFDQWASSLSQTEGFQEFVAYIRDNGPKVADALGAIGSAVLEVLKAAAPLGGPTLQALEAVADAIAAIAGSDAGPAIMATVTALTLLNRGMSTFGRVSSSTWAQNIKGANGYVAALGTATRTVARGSAALGGLAIAATGVADGIGMSNTASMALMGTIAGPWGAAMGAGVGLALDFAAGQRESKAAADELAATLDAQTGAITDNTRAMVAKRLEDDGTLQAAQDLGLSLETVTDAAMGNAEAIAQIKGVHEGWIGAVRDGDKAAQDQWDTWQKLSGGIASGTALLDDAKAAHNRLADAVGSGNEEIASSFITAKDAAQNFRDAVLAANRALEGRANMRDYEQAIDDLSKSVKENGKTLDINTQKGRANQAALDNIASRALRVAEEMRGSNRVEFLKQARKDFVDAAGKLGMGEDKATALWDRLKMLDVQEAEPKIVLEHEAAMRQAAAVKAQLDSIDRFIPVTIHVSRTGTGGDVPFVSGGQRPRESADGGTVPKTGKPYADRHLYLLADGEEVISNRHGQADRHRELLKAINSNRLAGGGTVGWERREAMVDRQGTFGAGAAAAGWRGGERVVERFPAGPVRLVVDGHEFSAYVESVAGGSAEIERARSRTDYYRGA